MEHAFYKLIAGVVALWLQRDVDLEKFVVGEVEVTFNRVRDEHTVAMKELGWVETPKHEYVVS